MFVSSLYCREVTARKWGMGESARFVFGFL